MKRKLNWKIIFVLAIIGMAIFLIYPPKDKIKLGLDLKGGMHLVFRVNTDDAIDFETDVEITRMKELLNKRDIDFQSINKLEQPGHFIVRNVNPAQQETLTDILNDNFKEWRFSFSGNTVSLSLKPNVDNQLRVQTVEQVCETIRNRIDQYGVSEPLIQKQGSDRIIVELPGVEDEQRAKGIIKSQARLEWKLVKAGPADSEEQLLADFNGEVPEDTEILKQTERTEDNKIQSESYYLVSKVATVTGKDLRDARRSVDEWDQPAVSFSLKPEGAKRFLKLTGEHKDELVAIVLDDKVISAPVIRERIPGEGIIHGNFTIESADDLSLKLRAGALPASLQTLEERTIGPSLGADSIRRGFISFSIAIILVMIFMLIYYHLSGFNAVFALTLNILILMGILAYFKASLTLPGIAGIILTVGMAVDANVLIFERIREELSTGKTVRSSISSGFSRAFKTILDANITTIIAAIFLFQFGTGPIKGFATTLIIGISASIFTAVFVSRLIFDLIYSKSRKFKKMSI